MLRYGCGESKKKLGEIIENKYSSNQSTAITLRTSKRRENLEGNQSRGPAGGPGQELALGPGGGEMEEAEEKSENGDGRSQHCAAPGGRVEPPRRKGQGYMLIKLELDPELLSKTSHDGWDFGVSR